LNPWYFPGIAEYAGVLESAGFEVREAQLFDRPTPLDGEDGLRRWMAMFGQSFLGGVSDQEQLLRRVEELGRPVLSREGQWVVNYRRLRMSAVKLG
jgi:hypothetical protein